MELPSAEVLLSPQMRRISVLSNRPSQGESASAGRLVLSFSRDFRENDERLEAEVPSLAASEASPSRGHTTTPQTAPRPNRFYLVGQLPSI
jgi:hypothetical protein